MDKVIMIIILWMIWCLILMIPLSIIASAYNRKINMKIELLEIEFEKEGKSLERVTELLNFLKKLTAEITVIKFREYQDQIQLDKTTRIKMSDLAKAIANEVKKALVEEKIDLSSYALTEEYLHWYLVQNAVMMVKNILEKAIDDSDLFI